MIAIDGLRKVYRQGAGRTAREIVALDDITLTVPKGEIFGILGHSGAGKSTLIRCLNLLERPTAGRVVVGGQDLTALDAAALRQQRRRIGMIFQHFHLLQSRTVAENVAVPLEILGHDRARRRARVTDLLDLVGLTDRADAYPGQLSGGQKQRVGIARALAAEPDVLLSDEATSALDSETTAAILDLLRDVNARLGVTILLITHELPVVKAICGSAALLERGRLVEHGRLADLAADPGSILGRALLPARAPVPEDDGAGVLAELTFVDPLAVTQLLGLLARELSVAVTLLGGGVELIGGRRIGRFQVALKGAVADPRTILSFLNTHGVGAVLL
ncbi:methionine ABC transporter ATP-binding protein [Nitrospirillum sp. BR 11163]|uniref:methionine ABC transporter ATP-binding protein n=1 Tax=Nitrospirillum sp. BR 11163 TaxID=3104323 RepID=UPI002AFE3082|nr:methionine ABC transporter ATP-binding protein [Nitrospirillum sp. BR 11163]MEA1674660.1 methionine ABC transporter ATP-binding protein [Nitrospirillum sp. BR 11163]